MFWTDWKGTLLQELYEKTYDIIEKKDFYQEQRSEKARNRKRKIRKALLGEFPESTVNRAINSLNNRYLMSIPFQRDHPSYPAGAKSR